MQAVRNSKEFVKPKSHYNSDDSFKFVNLFEDFKFSSLNFWKIAHELSPLCQSEVKNENEENDEVKYIDAESSEGIENRSRLQITYPCKWCFQILQIFTVLYTKEACTINNYIMSSSRILNNYSANTSCI